MDAEVPEIIGRYIVQKKLGEGAMGRVYLAQDPVLQRSLALKVIAIDRALGEKNREEYFNRFTTEARASARLGHPSIVTVYDAGLHDGLPWIAFEFVEGMPLDALLRKEGRLPVSRAVSIARDIAAGLQYAHDCRIVHRDVKPANILLDGRTGIAKLSDFGVVKAPWAVLTREGMVVGSPGYMSPEQIEGRDVDARSDIFSLGIVLYEMLTGAHPFIRDTLPATAYATVNAAYTPLRKLLPAVPACVENTVAAALRADREKRVQSAKDFFELLSPAVTGMSGDDSGFSARDAGGRAPAGRGDWWRSLRRVVVIGKNVALRTLCSARRAARAGRTAIGIVGAQDATPAWGAYGERVRRGLGRLRMSITGAPVRRLMQSARPTVAAVARNARRAVPFVRKHKKASFALFLLMTMLTTMALFRAIASRYADSRGMRATSAAERELPDELEQVARACREHIREKKYLRAESSSRQLAESLPASAIPHVLQGRIELTTGDYISAAREFDAASRMKGGTSALHRERAAILEDMLPVLTAREAPKTLVDVLTEYLSAAEDTTVCQWTGEKHYWLRWNAVAIMRAGNKDVDMVEVYILDLKHGGSIRTRMRAAEKIGELKDERALPALREAAALGWRDPFVSAKAQSVLERASGEKN